MNGGKLYESEFEQALVDMLQQEGWSYTSGDGLHRKVTEALLEDDLRDFLTAKYVSTGRLPADDLSAVIANIRNVGGATDYHSFCNAVRLYQNGCDVTPSNGLPPFHLHYIDFEHPEENIFRVVNQFDMVQGTAHRIPDVLLFVNGIPLCIMELKNPTDENATLYTAHTQITVRYRRDIPELLKYCAVACISDAGRSRMGTITSPFEYFYAWKKVENEDEAGQGLHELETLVQGALSPARLLEIVRDYVYLPDVSQNELAVVCRYPQFFATRKLRDHIVEHLRSHGGDGKGGTYFGATGCGKTFTMLFLARQLMLRCRSMLESPTILIIVDREDLETQAGKLFCNAKKFLLDDAVQVFESREDLQKEMALRKSGGLYVTTIQKFTESTGLLSDRSNIICMSDEAHRTQNNLGSKLKFRNGDKEKGAFFSYGFARHLRQALPQATYVGFTGTPIDETVHVFGQIVDMYTMKQSQEDGITVPIIYDPRLPRVFMNDEQARQIEEYYRQCETEGATQEDVDKSKRAMSGMKVILGDEGRLRRLASDVIADYEKRCEDAPDRVLKAMITCYDREIAYKLYIIMKELRPDWCRPLKALDETRLSPEELEKRKPVCFLNMVATRGKDDPKDMYALLGDASHRRELDTAFKDDKSNFHVAIVVDMWITGFDAPPLTVLYNDKPLQKHTLIQTISRVNRRYRDKEYGYIVDYFGIRGNMKSAMKQYSGQENQKDDLEEAHAVLKNELQILRDLTPALNFAPFFQGTPIARLQFLQNGAEYLLVRDIPVKGKPSYLTRFRGHVKRLHSAFDICNPAGLLSQEEAEWSQCFMGLCTFVNKMTASVHDVTSMNKAVEQMVKEAINCSGVENVFESQGEEDIFGEDFLTELSDVKLPFTKFQLMVKLLKQAIREYGKTNKVRADYFDHLLQKTINDYNTRDNLSFANDVAKDAVNSISQVVTDKVNSLTDELLKLFQHIKEDGQKFRDLGISFEEKAFYDVLCDTRDRHGFEYPDEKCIELAKQIKTCVDETSVYADWQNNDNLKNKLSSELLILLYKNGYPPEWKEEVYERVLEQVQNFKAHQA